MKKCARQVKFHKNELEALLNEASITKVMLAEKLGVGKYTVLSWFRQGHMPRHRWDKVHKVIASDKANTLPGSNLTTVRDYLVDQLEKMGYRVKLEVNNASN